MRTRIDYVPTGDGWELRLKRVVSRRHFRPDLRPLAIVPGYGMNAFIFGYHPNGASMERFLAERGFEVWSLYLRGQEGTRRLGGSNRFGMADLAIKDLEACFHHILEATETLGADRVDSIGCSLGGTYQFIHATCVPDHVMGSIVAIGAPLAWRQAHPIIRFLFGHPGIAGSIPFAFTRELAGLVFPLLLRIPAVLKLYMHPEITDVSKIRTLIQTVENPIARINAEIAHWIQDQDLIVNGKNVTEEMRRVTNPLLLVVANADGIVPRDTVMSAYEASGAEVKDVLAVGSRSVPMAHADLFVSRCCHELVFAPMADWLLERNGASARLPSPPARTEAAKRSKRRRKAAPRGESHA
jgi:pimeloyl-ACP methyl ester carboxylesterase